MKPPTLKELFASNISLALRFHRMERRSLVANIEAYREQIWSTPMTLSELEDTIAALNRDQERLVQVEHVIAEFEGVSTPADWTDKFKEVAS